MKTTTKLIALVLAMVLCLGVLAGCQEAPVETTTAPTTTAPAIQGTTTPATDPSKADIADIAQVNAEFYPIDFDGTLSAVTTKLNGDSAHNYLLQEELSGVDLDWQVITSEQAPLLFVGNSELPDLFFAVGGMSVAQINEYGQAGKLINFLDPEILDKMPNLKATYEADPKLFDSVKDANGAAYTLSYYCNTLTMAGNLFYIRTDMTKEAGITELPTTIEGFLEMCATLKEYYKDVQGYNPMVCNGAGSISYNGAYAQFFFPAFGDLMEPTLTTTVDGTKVAAGFATEQYKHYLEFMATLYKEGYMDPSCYDSDSNTNKARLIDKTTTMNPFATYLTPDNFADGTLDFQVYPPLSSEYQSEARWLAPNNYLAAIYCISTDCEDIDAACAFYDLMYTTQENPAKDKDGVKAWGISLWLGELNEDFSLNEEEGSYAILDHEGFDSGSAWLSEAGHGGAPYLHWPYYEASGTGLMVKALGTRDILKPEGISVMRTSLLTLTQEEQDAYNDVWTDISNHVAQHTAAFITGQESLDTDWDAYIDGLESMGLQDVLDVYQAALDRYNAG